MRRAIKLLSSLPIIPSARPFSGRYGDRPRSAPMGAAIMYTEMRLRDRVTLLLCRIARAPKPLLTVEAAFCWRFAATSRPSVITALLVAFSMLHFADQG
jgi:hypothetical protein